MTIDYSDWVSVVTSDDSTPIWSGPLDAAQQFIDSPQGQSFNRALSHRGARLVIDECVF